jgi:hypothetical protein
MRNKFAIFIICVLVTAVSVLAGCGSESDTGTPDLEPFLGGWGTINDSGSELEIVYVYEEDDKLYIEFGAIPGGGVIASFDPENVEVKSDSLTCSDGEALADGGSLSNIMVTAEPDQDGSGRYIFELTEDGKNILGGDVFSYDKIADTREDLDKWIKENDPL